jgi:hypothetical protein
MALFADEPIQSAAEAAAAVFIEEQGWDIRS